MMILDTNVISEILRTEPSGVVLTWLKMQEWTAMYVTTVTQAELRFGIALMPEGRRRQGLARAVVARAAGAAVATRNVKDFVGCGVEVINPWQAS